MNDVRDEALRGALDRVAQTIEAEPIDRLPEVLRRGSRHRNARFAAVGAAIAVFVAALSWAGLTIRSADTVPADVADWRTFASLEENGWTIQVPPPWQVLELPACPNAPERIGVMVTNVEFEFRDPKGGPPDCEDRLLFAGFPRDGVALAFMPRGSLPGLFPPPTDTVLPLTPDLLIVGGGIRGGPAESVQSIALAEDWLGVIRRYVGPDATDADVAALDRMLGTFRVWGAPRWVDAAISIHGLRVEVTHPDHWNLTTQEEIAAIDSQQPLVRLASPEAGGRFCLGIPWADVGTLGDFGAVVLVSDATAAWGPAEVGPRPERLRPSTAVEDRIVSCGQDLRVLRFLYEESGRRIAVDAAMTEDVLRESPEELWYLLDSIRVREA